MRHINYHCKQHPENNAISTWYFRLAAVLVILLVILTANGIAQESTGGSSAGYSQVVSANPFGVILLPWYNGEYERKITESITLGLSGSRLPWGVGGGFYNVGAALRYYPNATTSRQCLVGLLVGSIIPEAQRLPRE